MSPSSPPCTPPDSPQMAPSPLQHLPLDAALESHGNDTAFSPKTPSADPARSPLSPCDCRTLKKILEDVQSPSQTASPLLTKRNERHLGIDSSNDRSSDMGDEDEVQYTEKQYDYGDEADEGYADEDKSMDLSDAVDASVLHEDESELVRDDDTCENVWSDGDTIEEIMNAPGKTAPPAPDQDFGGVYLDDQPTLDETKGIKLQRAAIEEVLEQERLDREYQNAVAIEDEALGLDATITEDQEDAIVLSDDSEFQAVEAVQAEMSMSFVDGDMVEEMEVEFFKPFDHDARDDRRSSRRFSPAPPLRRASTDPLPSFSVTNILDFRPAVMSRPSGRHLDFTSNSTILDTPFIKTLHCFKQHKGKENSPSKSRRKAAPPEEIAELVRESEEEDLDKYRDIDLAPMEPVMESDTAGDLITFGTPMKARISTSGGSSARSDQPPQPVASFNISDAKKAAKLSPSAPILEQIVGTTSVEAHSSSPSRLSLSIEQNEDSDADVEYSDTASTSGDTQLILYPQHPTFVIVIGMLPAAFFWATAAPIAKYSTKAYDALIDKFAGLELVGG